jgi:hypothetical protein
MAATATKVMAALGLSIPIATLTLTRLTDSLQKVLYPHKLITGCVVAGSSGVRNSPRIFGLQE